MSDVFSFGVNPMKTAFENGAQGSRELREEMAKEIAINVLAISRQFGLDLLAMVRSLRSRSNQPVVVALMLQNESAEQPAYTKVVLDEQDRSKSDPGTKAYIARNQNESCIVFQVYWPNTPNTDFTCIALGLRQPQQQQP